MKLDAAAIEQGRKAYLELLELYKYCRERDEWWAMQKRRRQDRGGANFEPADVEILRTDSIKI